MRILNLYANLSDLGQHSTLQLFRNAARWNGIPIAECLLTIIVIHHCLLGWNGMAWHFFLQHRLVDVSSSVKFRTHAHRNDYEDICTHTQTLTVSCECSMCAGSMICVACGVRNVDSPSPTGQHSEVSSTRNVKLSTYASQIACW